MRKILLAMLLAVVAVGAFTSCDKRNKFDTLAEMKSKSSKIEGICDFKIGDSYEKVVSQCKSMKYNTIDNVFYGIDDIISDFTYKKEIPGWKFLMAEEFGICKYIFEFYKGKLNLILIKNDDDLIDDIINDYGLGVSVDSLHRIYKKYSYSLIHDLVDADYDYVVHCYINDYILLGCSIYNGELSDVICVSRTYIDVLSNNVRTQKQKIYKKLYKNSTSSNKSSSSKVRGRGTMDKNDEEYWESVNREEYLRKIGMDDAADLEHKARIRDLGGGGYHSKDGGSQVHFQGSKEQEEQLRQMDEMGW